MRGDLRLLSRRELLAARREGELLAQEGRDSALCANAALLARAVVREGRPLFVDGRAVLDTLGEGEIEELARQWDGLRRAHGPGLDLSREELEDYKAKLRSRPGERLRWRVLREFRVLPGQEEGDLLWCLVNGLLDREEELERLCPACRAGAAESRCPRCGQVHGSWEQSDNAAFDRGRFDALKEGRT